MPEHGRISPEQIADLKQRTDLRVIAGYFTQLKGTSREQYASCPRCGGRDRFHVQAHMFFCRSCYPPEGGKGRHDALDFIQFVGLAKNFREAFFVLASWTNTLPSSVRLLSEPIKRLPPDDWQTQARSEVVRCQQRLVSETGQVGQAYLNRRQIKHSTWAMANLGLAWRRDADGRAGWAIALPWIEDHGITAIQYRFIDPGTGQRYARFGYQGYYGATCLYRLPAKQVDTLVIVEGECNAITLWQDTAFDALSFGSENMTAKTITALRDAVKSFDRVLVWTDKASVAENLIHEIGRPATSIQCEHDANKLAQRGELNRFLA